MLMLKRPAMAISLAFLLMFPALAAHAMEIKNPQSVEQLDIDFRQYGTLELSGNNFEYLTLNITTLQDTANQDVSMQATSRFVNDERGNRKLAILQETPDKTFRYSVKGTARINAMHTYSLPQSYTIPEKVREYLYPTENIQSDSPRIRSLAKEITNGAGSDFQRVALLAGWVNANVNYTADLGEVAKDALWVLDNPIGTCDEFSTLFIALARSIGIPAKYISGYVYGPDGWQKHAWAEVYLGKWVPVDATWLEAGRLDATHIRFFETDDNYVANEAKAYGIGAGKIAWIEDETSIEVSNYREADAVEFEAFSSAGKLGGGKDIVVVAKISSSEYALDKLTLEPCTGARILDVANKTQKVMLQPKKQAVAWWKVSVNGSLDTNKIYTCPIVLNSNIFSKKTVDFVLDPRVKTDSRLEASLEKSYFEIGETVRVRVTDTGLSGASKIGVIADGFFDESETASSSASMSFSIAASSAGNHKIVAYDSDGSVKVLEYFVQETGKITMDEIQVPDFALVNTRPVAQVTIKNSMRTPQGIRLDAKTSDQVLPSESINVPAQSSIIANISIPAEAVGKTTLTIRLVADGVEEATRSIRIYDAPELLFDARYDPGTQKAVVGIISKKDEAKNITVLLAGKEEFLASSLEGRALYFDIPAGEYSIAAKYEDAAGKHYRAEGRITFEENFMDEIAGRWDKLIGWLQSVLGFR